MGLFDRLSTLLRSNINDLISRAENPEKMLNQLIVDMKGQLAKAKQQVASAIADEKKLQSDADAMKKQAEDWERRAMLAVQEGRDDMAKQALGRYNEHLQGAQQLHETWLRHKAETEQLKISLRQLNDKIEEAKRKKNILVARAKRAEAQQRIQETMSGMSDKSAFESFERMTEKIEASERKAIAAAELKEEVSGDRLARQFEALEYKGSSDQQLIELKQRMGLLPPGGAGRHQAAQQGRRRRARRRADRGRGERAEPRMNATEISDRRRRRLRADDLEDRQLGHPLSPRPHGRRAGSPAGREDRAGRARLRRGACPSWARCGKGWRSSPRPSSSASPRWAVGCRRNGASGWRRRSTAAATCGAGCTPSWATIRCWPSGHARAAARSSTCGSRRPT